MTAVGLAVATSGRAADGTWTSLTSGNWTTSSRWQATIADGSGFTANFGTLNPTADVTVTLNGNRTIGHLIFGDTAPASAAGWEVTGNTLTLATASGQPSITVNALGDSKAATISSVLAGSAGFAKNGSGTLILSSTNTITGTVNVNAGTLKLGRDSLNLSNGPLGPLNTSVGKVVVASGATVDFGGFIDNTYGYTISGTGVGGAGALVNTGTAIGNGYKQASNIRLAADASIGGTGDWALLAASYTATSLDLAGHTLTKTGANTIGLVSTTVTAGAIDVMQGTLGLGIGGNGTGVSAASTAVTLANTAGVGMTVSQNSSLGSLAGGGATGGGTSVAASVTLTVGGLGTDTTYGGVLSGAGALVKTGSGTLTLTGGNTYTGATTINAGALRASNATALGTTAAGTTVASGGALELSGGVTIGTEALSLTGSGVSNGGALRNVSGNNTYGGAITLGGAARINSDAGTLTLGNAISAGNNALTFGGSGNTTVTGSIGGTGASVVKDGAGTITLSTGNTYTGATTINAGALRASNATALGTTAAGTTVASGGALELSGGVTIGTEALSLTGSGVSNGGALRNVSGNNTYGGAITLGGAARINSDAGTLTLGNAISAGNNALTFGGSGNITVAGGLTTTAALVNDGAGTTLMDSATNATSVSVTAGTLAFDGEQTANRAANNATITVGTGATVEIRATNPLPTGGNAVNAVINGGTWHYGTADTHGHLNNVTFTNGGTLSAVGGAPHWDGEDIQLNGNVSVTGNAAAAMDLSVGLAGAKTFTVADVTGSSAADLTISQGLNDAFGFTGGVVKEGGGTLLLTPANTHTGSTTVNAGVLEVGGTSGALANTSAISVTGGTLLLSGSAADRLNNAATVSLGTGSHSVAALAATGAIVESVGTLSLLSNGVIDLGAGSALLTFANIGTWTGSLHVWNWTGTALQAGGTDRLIFTSGSLSSAQLANVQFYSDSGTTPIGSGAGFIGSELVPVPEPGAALTALFLSASALWQQRRRRK